jgi:HSP20 family protein
MSIVSVVARTAAPRAAQREEDKTMAMKDLIPWNRGREVSAPRSDELTPFFNLHREINRLFDEAFRGFDLSPFGSDRFSGRGMGWPSLEVSESDRDYTVTAELPGLEEKDVQVEFVDGVLVMKGEKKTETEDKDRRFSERTYGQFERRIPVEGIDMDNVTAIFKNGVLTVKMPKLPDVQSKVKRISITGK